LGLPKGNGPDNASGYLKGTIAGGGLWAALDILDNALLQGSVNTLDNVTLTSPNIGADQWSDANHTHASPATAGSTLGPGTTLSTPTLQTPAVSGVMTLGGDATLARTGPGALRADTHLGVGVSPPTDANAQWPLVRVGASGSVTGNPGNQAMLSSNAYQATGVGWRPIAAGTAGAVLEVGPAGWAVHTTSAVALGSSPVFTTRAQIAPTGTLTLTPDAGQATINGGGTAPFTLTTGTMAAANARLYAANALELVGGGGQLLLSSAATIVGPPTDGTQYLGWTSTRWASVYAVTGTIQTSSQEFKEGITPLSPERAMQAVRDTEAVTFDYVAPTRGPEWYDLPDDPEQAEAVLQQRLTAAPLEAAARHQAGFIAEAADELFLVGEGQTSPSHTAGILLAALQQLDQRVQALEGTP
jgi:hypothetical protein